MIFYQRFRINYIIIRFSIWMEWFLMVSLYDFWKLFVLCFYFIKLIFLKLILKTFKMHLFWRILFLRCPWCLSSCQWPVVAFIYGNIWIIFFFWVLFYFCFLGFLKRSLYFFVKILASILSLSFLSILLLIIFLFLIGLIKLILKWWYFTWLYILYYLFKFSNFIIVRLS